MTSGRIEYGGGSNFIPQPGAMDVLTAARARFDHLFSAYDTVLLSHSGGKDSTVLYNLAREAAHRNQKPLHVVYCDEEISDPDTLAYLEDVYQEATADPLLTFHWCCANIQHTIRSDFRDAWWPWDPDEEARWFRPKPTWARPLPESLSKRATGGELRFDGVMKALFPRKEFGRVVQMAGIRTEESVNRYRDLINAGHYITNRNQQDYAKPIYDWRLNDVWLAIGTFKWAYSKIYDKLARYGLSIRKMRVSSWGNVAAAREVAMWSELYPETWQRALLRLPELGAQARYGNTKLFRKGTTKPAGMTWQDWTWRLVKEIPDPERRRRWEEEIAGSLRRWSRAYSVPFPERPIPGTHGICWKQLAYRVSKNDIQPRDRPA